MKLNASSSSNKLASVGEGSLIFTSDISLDVSFGRELITLSCAKLSLVICSGVELKLEIDFFYGCGWDTAFSATMFSEYHLPPAGRTYYL